MSKLKEMADAITASIAGKYLRRKADDSGYEWVDAGSVINKLTDIGDIPDPTPGSFFKRSGDGLEYSWEHLTGSTDLSKVIAVKTANQNITRVINNLITWDLTKEDTKNEFIGDTFTATHSGVYSISVSIFLSTVSTQATGAYTLCVYVDGVKEVSETQISTGLQVSLSLESVLELQAGSSLQVYVSCDSLITPLVIRTADSSPTTSYIFTNSIQGFTGTGVTLAAGTSAMRVTPTTIDPNLEKILSISGILNSYIIVRIKRIAGSAWDGSFYYTTAAHNHTEAYKSYINQPAWDGGFKDIVISLSHISDWVNSIITGLRFDFGASLSDIFDIESIKFYTTLESGTTKNRLSIVRIPDTLLVEGATTLTGLTDVPTATPGLFLKRSADGTTYEWAEAGSSTIIDELTDILDIPLPVEGMFLKKLETGYAWETPERKVLKTLLTFTEPSKMQVKASLIQNAPLATLTGNEFWAITLNGTQYFESVSPDLINDSFSLANGAAADSNKWTTALQQPGNSNGSITHQSNTLRMVLGTSSGASPYFSYTILTSRASLIGDYDISVLITNLVAGAPATSIANFGIWSTSGNTGDSLSFRINLPDRTVVVVNDESPYLTTVNTALAGTAFPLDVTNQVFLRIEKRGSTHSFKASLTGQGTFTTIATTTSGVNPALNHVPYISLKHTSSTTGVQQTTGMNIDSFSYTPIGSPVSNRFTTSATATMKSLAVVRANLAAKIAVNYPLTVVDPIDPLAILVQNNQSGTLVYSGYAYGSDYFSFQVVNTEIVLSTEDTWSLTIDGDVYLKNNLDGSITNITQVVDYYVAILSARDRLVIAKIGSNLIQIENLIPGELYSIYLASNPVGRLTLQQSISVGILDNLTDVTDVPDPSANLTLRRNSTNTMYEWVDLNAAYAPIVGGKIPVANLPDSVVGALIYQSTWNATTNSPAIPTAVGRKGWYYKVSVSGTTVIDGVSEWGAGDWIVSNGTTWDKIDNSELNEVFFEGITNISLTPLVNTSPIANYPIQVSFACEVTSTDGFPATGSLLTFNAAIEDKRVSQYLYGHNGSLFSRYLGLPAITPNDDFENASIDTSKWHTYSDANSVLSEVGGYLGVTSPSGIPYTTGMIQEKSLHLVYPGKTTYEFQMLGRSGSSTGYCTFIIRDKNQLQLFYLLQYQPLSATNAYMYLNPNTNVQSSTNMSGNWISTGVRTRLIFDRPKQPMHAERVSTGSSPYGLDNAEFTPTTQPTVTINITTNIVTLALAINTNHVANTTLRPTAVMLEATTFPTLQGGSSVLATDVFYFRYLSTTTCTLHPTRQDAIDNTNVIDFTSTGSGVRMYTIGTVYIYKQTYAAGLWTGVNNMVIGSGTNYNFIDNVGEGYLQMYINGDTGSNATTAYVRMYNADHGGRWKLSDGSYYDSIADLTWSAWRPYMPVSLLGLDGVPDAYDGPGKTLVVNETGDGTVWEDISTKYAGLVDGKVPSEYLPSSIVGSLKYKGTWNSFSNVPEILTGSANEDNCGNYYTVASDSSTLVDGISDWRTGDWIVSNGTTWDKIDNTDGTIIDGGTWT